MLRKPPPVNGGPQLTIGNVKLTSCTAPKNCGLLFSRTMSKTKKANESNNFAPNHHEQQSCWASQSRARWTKAWALSSLKFAGCQCHQSRQKSLKKQGRNSARWKEQAIVHQINTRRIDERSGSQRSRRDGGRRNRSHDWRRNTRGDQCKTFTTSKIRGFPATNINGTAGFNFI